MNSPSDTRSRLPVAEIWSLVVDATRDIVYALRPSGECMEANPSFCRLFRQPREAIIGMPITTHLSPDHVKLTERVLRDIVERKLSERSTRTYAVPGQEPVTIEVMESPLLRDGAVWGIVGVGRDITQEVVLEHKLWDAAEERQAAADFALRTSLGLVKGYVYALGRHEAVNEHSRIRYARIIEEEIDHLSKIIEDMLDLRRLEQGTVQEPAEIVDLKSCLEWAVTEYREEANRRAISLDLKLPDAIDPLYVPREALIRVLLNLVQNAIHHTLHSGQVMLEVQDEDAYVEIVVRDNGVGIPENELPLIFDKYYQGAGNAAATTAGVGLGLTVARTLVEAMGGRILVSSQLGSGSEFRVVIPRRAAGWVGDARSVATGGPENESPARSGVKELIR